MVRRRDDGAGEQPTPTAAAITAPKSPFFVLSPRLCRFGYYCMYNLGAARKVVGGFVWGNSIDDQD